MKKKACKTVEITDKYNPLKVWIIKRYTCGHYYTNQKIAGEMLLKRDIKTTAKWVQTALDWSEALAALETLGTLKNLMAERAVINEKIGEADGGLIIELGEEIERVTDQILQLIEETA